MGLRPADLYAFFQVGDFVLAHGEAEGDIGFLQGGAAASQDVKGAAGRGRAGVEEVGEVGIDAFGHPVVDGVHGGGEGGEGKLVAAPVGHDIADAAFDAPHLGESGDGE